MKLTIYMEPVGKGRPRAVRRGKKVVTYTPDKTAHAENLIRDKALELGEKFPPHTPLKAKLIFYRTKPKSSKFRLPVTRPDWDNLSKLVSDSLEGFAYDNDSQITTAFIAKRWGEPARIEITLEEETL